MAEKVDNKVIRKQKIGKAAKIFIIIMIVLTFFSKTIINMTLPKVTMGRVSYGEVNKEIYGSGEIIAKDSIEHYTKLTLPVKDIKVKIGDYVEEGDVLVILDDENIKEQIIDKECSLKVSKNNLRKQFLDKEELKAEDFLFIRKAIEEIEEEITSKNDKEEIMLSLEEKRKALERIEAYKELEETKENNQRYIKKKEIDIENQKLNIEQLEGEIVRLNSKLKNIERKMERVSFEFKESDIREAEYERLKTEYNITNEQIIDKEYSLKTSENELKKLLLEREEVQFEKPFLSKEIFKETIEELTKEIAKMESEEDKQKIILELNYKGKELEKAEKNRNRDIERLEIDIKSQELAIEKIKLDIEKLHANIKECEIRAEASGIVRELNFDLGRFTNEIEPVYALDIIETGCQVSLKLPIEQESIIKEGQEAIVEIIDLNTEKIKGVVDSIRIGKDSSDIQVFIEVDNKDCKIGQMANCTILLEGDNFNAIVPNFAIHKDGEDSYYVFGVEEKSGALGEEYYIVRKDIEIGISNNAVSGIKSGLNGSENIVFNSNKSLKEGMRVIIND